MINNSNLYNVTGLTGQPVVVVDGVAFPVGGGGSSSMEFYRCAEVFGPRKISGFSVSGAGTTEVNGKYLPSDETVSGVEEIYKHENSDFYLYRIGSYWYIAYTMQATYAHYSSYSLGEWYTESEGTSPAPTVSQSQITVGEEEPKTWNGYKAILEDGVYSFESSLSSGLTYGSGYSPEVGGIYSEDAMIRVDGLFSDVINRFENPSNLFALDSSKGVQELVQGISPTQVGSGEVLQGGEFCFDSSRALDYPISSSLSALQDFTIEMDYTITSNQTGYCGFFGNKSSWSSMCVCMQWGRSGYRPAMFWNGYFDTTTGGEVHPEWVEDGVYHHVAMVRKGTLVSLYSDGIRIATYSGATLPLNLAIQNLLAIGTQHVENAIFPGRMRHFRILGEALYEGDSLDGLPTWVGAGSSEDSGDSEGGGEIAYDYDQLTASGFEGYGFGDNSVEVSFLNGTWTRTTSTDHSTLQANGFRTEEWQLDGGTAVLLYTGTEWAVMSPTLKLVLEINQYPTPWDVPAGEWYGEMVLPVGRGVFSKSGGINSGGTGGEDDSEDSGDNGSSDKPYVYTASGAGSTEANGNYWDSGTPRDGKPVYTNGQCELYLDKIGDVTIIRISDGVALYARSTGAYTTIVGGYRGVYGQEPAPTVTEYSGGTPDYVVSNATDPNANGDYFPSDETGFDSTPVYKSANGYAIMMSAIMGWTIWDSTGMDRYASMNFDSEVPTGNWGNVTVTKG